MTTRSIDVQCTTIDGRGVTVEQLKVSIGSRIGQMFVDPTVHSITITHQADGAILKGDRSRTYERLPQ